MFDIFCHKIFFNFENVRIKDLLDVSLEKGKKLTSKSQFNALAIKNGSSIAKYLKQRKQLKNEIRRCANELLHEKALQEKNCRLRREDSKDKE